MFNFADLDYISVRIVCCDKSGFKINRNLHITRKQN